MADVLRIAKKHWKARQNAPLGIVTVPEWLDDSQTPVRFEIRRLNSAEQTAINEAQRVGGDRGGQAVTVIKSCFHPGEEKRIFADTDQKALLEDVDPVILRRIHDEIQALILATEVPA